MVQSSSGPSQVPAQATWPHFLRPPSPHFLPLTLPIPNPVLAKLSLPPYLFKPCDLASAHLLSTQATHSKGSVTSLLSDPMTIFRPPSSWPLSGSGNDDCSPFKLWRLMCSWSLWLVEINYSSHYSKHNTAEVHCVSPQASTLHRRSVVGVLANLLNLLT